MADGFKVKSVDNITGNKHTVSIKKVIIEKCPKCKEDLRTTGNGRYCKNEEIYWFFCKCWGKKINIFETNRA